MDRGGVWRVVEEGEGRRIRRANGVISMIKPAAAEPLLPPFRSFVRCSRGAPMRPLDSRFFKGHSSQKRIQSLEGIQIKKPDPDQPRYHQHKQIRSVAAPVVPSERLV